jgi:hypothetical protein
VTRAILGSLAAAALAAASAAHAQSVSIEAFGGWQNLRVVSDLALVNEDTGIVGGDVLGVAGPLALGLLVDRTVRSGGPWVGAFIGGFVVPVWGVRIEALGEGGRRAAAFGDLFGSAGVTFAGFRPGVTFRVPGTPIFVGASGFARWPVSVGGRDLNKPDYGLVGRCGLGWF